MRHYELVVVLSPMISPDEASQAWERIKGFITNREADIVHEERWGTRRLAYPVKKGQYQFLEGNYHLTRFSSDQAFNRELENYLKLDDNVLRSLVTITLSEEELAAHAAQTRAPRPPRPPAGAPPAGGPPGAAPAAVAAAPTEAAPAAVAGPNRSGPCCRGGRPNRSGPCCRGGRPNRSGPCCRGGRPNRSGPCCRGRRPNRSGPCCCGRGSTRDANGTSSCCRAN